MSDIKTISLEELRRLRAQGVLNHPTDPKNGEDLPDNFWDEAEIVMPQPKKAVSLRVDPDILDFFKAQGSGHLTRMHAVLRAYVDAQRKAQSR